MPGRLVPAGAFHRRRPGVVAHAPSPGVDASSRPAHVVPGRCLILPRGCRGTGRSSRRTPRSRPLRLTGLALVAPGGAVQVPRRTSTCTWSRWRWMAAVPWSSLWSAGTYGAPALGGVLGRPDVVVEDDGGQREPVGVRDQPVGERPARLGVGRVVVRPEEDVDGSALVVRRALHVTGRDTAGSEPAEGLLRRRFPRPPGVRHWPARSAPSALCLDRHRRRCTDRAGERRRSSCRTAPRRGCGRRPRGRRRRWGTRCAAPPARPP